MPYSAFDSDDSDDLIVLEITTDEDDNDSDEIDYDSDGLYTECAPLDNKKRTMSVTSNKSNTKKAIKAEPSPVGKLPATKQRAAQASREKATTSRKRKIEKNIKIEDDDDDEQEEKEIKRESNPSEEYTTMTDAEVNAIIETDLSMGAELVTEEIITEDATGEEALDEIAEVEEKVFTELPNKYLLYDELVATIIGFDGETPIVEFSSTTRDELKHIEKKLPVECGICPSILSAAHLSEHLKVHQDVKTRRFNCIYCDNTACNRHSAASHSRRHLGIRPYACDICDNYFTTKNDLKLHYQRKHLEREFICEMCGKAYAQNTFLKRHIESHHQDKRPHQCDYCPKSYHRRGNLKEHIEAVHMGNRKPLSCRFCGIEFRDSHKLSRHRKEEHLNKSQFDCGTCGVEFTDIQFFNAHKRSIQCKNNRMALKIEDSSPTEEAVEVVLS